MKMLNRKMLAHSSVKPRLAVPIPRYEIWELYGELGIAFWTAGRNIRASAAFDELVKGMLTAWRPTNRRFREVYRKTSHVLGWYAPVAAGRAPPQTTAGGGEYMPPTPGFFNRKKPQIADLTTPMPKALLPYLLGRILNGLWLEHAALNRLALARDISREERTWWLLAQIQVILSPIESVLGPVDGAMADALEGIRLITSLSTLDARGQDPLVSQADPESIWDELPVSKKAEAQTLLFWLTAAPWLTSLLSLPSDSDARPWIDAVSRYSTLLVDPDYWKRVFDTARSMIVPLRRDEAIREINSLPSTDVALRYTLHFCTLRATGCLPSDALVIHASLLNQMVDRLITDPWMVCKFCSYVADYWHTASQTKGFQLYSPAEFRSRMEAVRGNQGLATVCQILLWAEQTTRTVILQEIRAKLASLITPNLQSFPP